MLSSVLMSLRRSALALPVLVVFFALSAARADTSGAAGTFPEDYLPGLKPILETALRQSYQVVAKQIELEQSTARVYGADSGRLPSLGGNLNYATNKSANSDNSSASSRASGVFYGLWLNQALYHWGALKAEGDKARIGVLIAEKSYREASRVMAVATRRAYMDLIVRKILIEQMRYARDLLVSDLALAKDKLKDGLVSAGDVGGREFNLKDVMLRMQRAEIEFTGMRRSFVRMTGISELPESAIPSDIPKPLYSSAATAALLQNVVHDGGRSSFQAAVAELRVKEADLNYRIQRVRLLPMFNASAGYSLENNTSVSGGNVDQQAVTRQTISVGAEWHIFDGFATKGAKLEARAAQRASQRQLQEAAESAVETAQTLAQQLDLDAQEIDMADIRFGLAASAVKKLQDELQLGNVPQSAVDNALSEQKLRAFGSANARAAYLSRWSEFASLVGSDPAFNQLPVRHDRPKR